MYVTREVDGTLFNLLDETQKTAVLYQQMESDRTAYLLNFAVLYFALALLLIVSSVLFALWFAERLSQPIGRLAAAAKRVGAGELTTQVIEDEGDDEIAQLGRYFNQMTKQLKYQRDTLVDNTEQIEERRQLFDSVLSSVTSGVIVLDPDGEINFTNNSANVLLNYNKKTEKQNQLSDIFPELNSLFEKLRKSRSENLQSEIKLIRSGRIENFLVSMAPMNEDENLKGYVVAFDDVTSLVSAQRSAAWGDVARRIAHEIKNPLTPIQLTIDRLKNKYSAEVDEKNRENFKENLKIINNQIRQIEKLVNEFSDFARMPKPTFQKNDLVILIEENIKLLQELDLTIKIDFNYNIKQIFFNSDKEQLSRVFLNLIKNSIESIQQKAEKMSNFNKNITIELN